MAMAELLRIGSMFESLERVSADRFEHSDPRLCTRAGCRHQQALRQQLFDHGELDAGNALGRLERAPAGEDGQPRKGVLLFGIE